MPAHRYSSPSYKHQRDAIETDFINTIELLLMQRLKGEITTGFAVKEICILCTEFTARIARLR